MEKFYSIQSWFFFVLANKQKKKILTYYKLQTRDDKGRDDAYYAIKTKNIWTIYFLNALIRHNYGNTHVWVSKFHNMEEIRNVEDFWRVAKRGRGTSNKRKLFNIRTMLITVVWNFRLEINRKYLIILNWILVLYLFKLKIILFYGQVVHEEEAVARSSIKPTQRVARRKLDLRPYLENRQENEHEEAEVAATAEGMWHKSKDSEGVW